MKAHYMKTITYENEKLTTIQYTKICFTQESMTIFIPTVLATPGEPVLSAVVMFLALPTVDPWTLNTHLEQFTVNKKFDNFYPWRLNKIQISKNPKAAKSCRLHMMLAMAGGKHQFPAFLWGLLPMAIAVQNFTFKVGFKSKI